MVQCIAHTSLNTHTINFIILFSIHFELIRHAHNRHKHIYSKQCVQCTHACRHIHSVERKTKTTCLCIVCSICMMCPDPCHLFKWEKYWEITRNTNMFVVCIIMYAQTCWYFNDSNQMNVKYHNLKLQVLAIETHFIALWHKMKHLSIKLVHW